MTDSPSSEHSGSKQQKKRAQQYTTSALPGAPGQNYVPGCRISGRNFFQIQTLSGLQRAKMGRIQGKKRTYKRKTAALAGVQQSKSLFACVR